MLSSLEMSNPNQETVETHVRSIFHELGSAPGEDPHRGVLTVVTWLREA